MNGLETITVKYPTTEDVQYETGTLLNIVESVSQTLRSSKVFIYKSDFTHTSNDAVLNLIVCDYICMKYINTINKIIKITRNIKSDPINYEYKY